MPLAVKIGCVNIRLCRLAVKRRDAARCAFAAASPAVVFATVVLPAIVLLCPAAAARQPSAEAITVADAYVRASLPGVSVSAMYMRLYNGGDEPRALVAAETAAAASVELHTHVMGEGGVGGMRRTHEIVLEPGAATVLRPGGAHIMLLGVKKPLSHGGRVNARLFYRDGSVSAIVAPVIDINRKR